MITTSRKLNVFLCYAHSDHDRVRKLYARLTKDGVNAWLDEEKIMPGQDWDFEIRKAVRQADVVVVCLSKKFNEMGYRQKEVSLALDTAIKQPTGEIFIIPARLEACGIIESLEKWHWVNLFEPNGYEKLWQALCTRAEKIGLSLGRRSWSPLDSLPRIDSGTSPKKELNESKQDRQKVREKNDETPKSENGKKRKVNTAVLVALIGLAGIFVTAVLSSPLVEKWFFDPTPNVTQTAETSSTLNPEPSITPGTPTKDVSPPTVTPVTGTAPIISSRDNMPLILIPAGEFLMGSRGNTSDERPVHKVYLDTFLVDQTEVTNGMYALCVAAEVCEPPVPNTSITHNESNNSIYYGNKDFDNYPVIYISWKDAKAYCSWAGRRLPTEAEWEKAASWDDQQKIKRLYPWGNKIDCTYANYYSDEGMLCVGDTTPVGSYLKGASYYGVLDMAGNVREWVADRYAPEYYEDSALNNPIGPLSGDFMVIRGGSFLFGRAVGIRSSDRDKLPPTNTSHNVGFRCAMDAAQ